MLGTLNTDHKEVTVIGGGIAGLLAAWRLDQLGGTVTFMEKEYRSGGRE